jgi:hypothetical protein
MGERAWKEIAGRLQNPCYLSRVDHDWKIRGIEQRTDIGKYSFLNGRFQPWNRLPADALGT